MDALLERRASCVSVLDISGAALDRVRARLGDDAARVRWIEADVTGDWRTPRVDVWHDRALFHFLTEADDRRRYVERVREAVVNEGAVILSTFALTGPCSCSGLAVMRHSAATLSAELGPQFSLVKSFDQDHTTPWGTTQAFCWTLFRRVAMPTP